MGLFFKKIKGPHPQPGRALASSHEQSTAARPARRVQPRPFFSKVLRALVDSKKTPNMAILVPQTFAGGTVVQL
jgi:hypothetical protein